MGLKEYLLFALFVSAISAQSYRVCVSQALPSSVCQSISKDDSQAQCLSVESRVDCALKLASNNADVGYFSEEETILLGLQQPDNHRVIATVRDAQRLEPYAFEAVAVVPSNHTNGLEGLRGGVYCHPGLDQSDLRWSPRVLKTLELQAARTDRCPNTETAQKTAEELEVEALNEFFSGACRPGTWSANVTVDAALKSRFPNLCSLCGVNANCSRYTIDMGINVAGVRNDNRHIQALECLRTNVNASRSAVAYVAWQHVREYFTTRNPQDAGSFSILCPNNTLVSLTNDILGSSTSPCALVRQPWGTIVANPTIASTLLTSLRLWWPNGANPGGNSWQSIMYTALAGGSNARVVFEDAPIFPVNYSRGIRDVLGVDASASCLPARRWCVLSTNELAKCNWVRTASNLLGLQPPIACLLRNNVFECLADIRDDKADFISAGSNYGYLARQHYRLTPVKLVQNAPAAASRVAAFVKESTAGSQNITRFENLRGRRACFPEFGGLAYMAFVRAGQERGVLSTTECDYARAVGEFFSGACAPGAIDASHALDDGSLITSGPKELLEIFQANATDTSKTLKSVPKPHRAILKRNFDSSVLCTVCRPVYTTTVGNLSNQFCNWDYSNMYFGNNGSLSCLADASNDVAFLNTRNIASHLQALNLQPNQFRALCRNNSLALNPGVSVDDNCLLAYVVDAEVLTRRNDPLYNSLNVLFDTLEDYFGYTAASGNQLINFELFSSFDDKSDLLFKDSTIGLTEPTSTSTHEPARNYIELFRHLQACTGSANSLGARSIYSILALVVMAFMTRFVVV